MKYRFLLFALACVLASACSAIVSTDETELGGGRDAGGGGFDAGTRDTGTRDTGTPPTDSGLDGGPACPGGCNDGVTCTTDRCVAGACENNPDDGRCGMDERCNPMMGCVSIFCGSDAECDDGLICNGAETCDPRGPGSDPVTGCAPGEAPVCDDGADCTADGCNEAAGGCVHTPDDGPCDDGIDCTVDACDPDSTDDPSGCLAIPDDTACATGFCSVGGTCSVSDGGCTGGTARDCLDGDPCTIDSCDDAAAMCVHAGRDADGDGYPAMRVSGMTCPGGTDCNDGDPSIHPMAMEICNMRDDNCNGLTDELCTPLAGDTCTSAQQITVSPGGSAVVTGRLGDFAADYQTACGASGGRDAVYYIDVTELVDITIDTIGSMPTDTVLGVGTTCSNAGFRMACDDDIDTGVNQRSRIWVHRIGPASAGSATRLYILVDGYNGGATGAYTLNVSMRRAAPDSCAAPIDISGGGSLAGFISGGPIMIGAPRGSCQSVAESTLREAVATFMGPTDGNVRMAVYSDDFDPDLYIRQTPCASGMEVACLHGDGGGAAGYTYQTTLTATTVAGARHYLFTDGAAGAGRYFVSFEP